MQERDIQPGQRRSQRLRCAFGLPGNDDAGLQSKDSFHAYFQPVTDPGYFPGCRRVLAAAYGESGRAHVRTPVTNAHLVCRFPLDKIHTTIDLDDITVSRIT